MQTDCSQLSVSCVVVVTVFLFHVNKRRPTTQGLCSFESPTLEVGSSDCQITHYNKQTLSGWKKGSAVDWRWATFHSHSALTNSTQQYNYPCVKNTKVCRGGKAGGLEMEMEISFYTQSTTTVISVWKLFFIRAVREARWPSDRIT